MISPDDSNVQAGFDPTMDRLNKVREAYAVLLNGISVTRYDRHQPDRNTEKKKYTQIVWLEPTKMRICCATVRPSGNDLTKGVISKGIYMRDVADIIIDASTRDFTSAIGAVFKKEACMTIVGSDMTISIELPTKFVRDWLVLRLGYLVTDILTNVEKADRARWRLALDRPLTKGNVETAKHLMNVLRRGIQVLSHHTSGNIYSSVLTFDEKNKLLLLDCLDTYILGIRKIGRLQIKMMDLVALRMGTHSFNFVKTKSTHKWKESFLIISTAEVFHLELVSESARDIFSEKFKIFCQYMQALAYKEGYEKSKKNADNLLYASKDETNEKSFYHKMMSRARSGRGEGGGGIYSYYNEGAGSSSSANIENLEEGTRTNTHVNDGTDTPIKQAAVVVAAAASSQISRALDTSYGLHSSTGLATSSGFQPKRRAINTGKFRHTHNLNATSNKNPPDRDTGGDLYNIV